MPADVLAVFGPVSAKALKDVREKIADVTTVMASLRMIIALPVFRARGLALPRAHHSAP
jgi:hypothetical protein